MGALRRLAGRPVLRQLRGEDPFGRGTAARSDGTEALRARIPTRTALRGGQDLGPGPGVHGRAPTGTAGVGRPGPG
jgi:hypothetical protein